MIRPALFAAALVTTVSACSSDKQRSEALSKILNKSDEVVLSPEFVALAAQGGTPYIVSVEARENAFSVFLQKTVNAKNEETWISGDRLSLGMIDGMVIATRGFGGDALAIDASQTIAALNYKQTGIVERFVTFLDGNDIAQTIAFRCEIEQRGEWPIDLGSYTSQTVLMRERCVNGNTRFTNRFWIDLNSNDIVQSRQWISEHIGMLSLRVAPL